MNKAAAFLFILQAWVIPCHAQAIDSVIQAEVYTKDTWQLIDTTGKVLMSQKLGKESNWSPCFSEGMAMTQADGKVGFITFDNVQVIPNRYDQAMCFQFGYAAVAIGDKWGIIDRQNQFIVQPTYEFAGNFGPEGLAAVIQDGLLGFVDTTGKLVIPFRYHWYSSYTVYPHYPFFCEGLIAIVDESPTTDPWDGKVGFMNTRGEVVIPPQYDFRGSFLGLPLFIEGRASVVKGDTTFVIDTLGNVLLATTHHTKGGLYFQDGFASIYAATGHQGIMDEKGNIVLEPKYNGVTDSPDGLFAVQLSGDENGVVSAFANRRGEFVFDRTFGFIEPFYEGLAAVEVDRRWGFIDTTGKFIVEPQYFAVNAFRNGLAIVAIQKGRHLRYGFIDKTGKLVIPAIYRDASEFEHGLAPVRAGKKFGYINKSGEMVIPPQYERAYQFEAEYFHATF